MEISRGCFAAFYPLDRSQRGIGITSIIFNGLGFKFQTLIETLPMIGTRHFLDHRHFYKQVFHTFGKVGASLKSILPANKLQYNT